MKSNLVEALANATPEDLAEVRERIHELDAELTRLRMAEKLLHNCLETQSVPKEPSKLAVKAAPTPAGPKLTTDEIKEQAYNLLMKEGSMPAQVLAARLGEKWRDIGRVLKNCDWFEKHPTGDWGVAKVGGNASAF